MIYNVNAKNCKVTDSMRKAVESHFNLLPASDEDVLNVTIEIVHKQAVRTKVVLQTEGSYYYTATIIDDDFYTTVEVASKKIKQQIKKRKDKLTSVEKTNLGRCFENSLTLENSEESFCEIEKEIKVPIYTMSVEEALDQMVAFNYYVMMFTTGDSTVRTLVRQPDGGVKLYTGIYA